MSKERKYGTDGNDSSIGSQINKEFYVKKALIEVAKSTTFSALASTTAMPKNFGKTIKQYHYLPLLDDRNTNDQGIDASGVSTIMGVTIQVAWSAEGTIKVGQLNGDTVKGTGASASAALTDAQGKAVSILKEMGLFDTDYATSKALAESKGFSVAESAAYPVSGNLYGSSKDVGTITSRLPVLSETGGRVNRVGFKRIEIESTLEKYGFFDEYTQDSLDFDTDAELEMHVNREMLNGANEVAEDLIQLDLLNGAGVVMFAGESMSDDTLTGEVGSTISEISYDDIEKLGIELQNNRCPKQTKIITGSRMVDTKVVDGGYIAYVGSALIPTLRRLEDSFGDKALVEAKHYADASTLIKGELGSIDVFRIVVADEMMYWEGAGADVVDNAGYRETGGKYNIFPFLVVGNESFTTIGFTTDGKGSKFKIAHKKPGIATADRTDPYGETGFMSIKWNYATLILRPERIALLKTVARI